MVLGHMWGVICGVSVHLCEGPKTLKAAGHSCSEAALPSQRGEQQAVLGRVGLVGPVGPAKLLNGLVGGPGQLQGEMDPPLLVLGTPAVVIIMTSVVITTITMNNSDNDNDNDSENENDNDNDDEN